MITTVRSVSYRSKTEELGGQIPLETGICFRCYTQCHVDSHFGYCAV
jgi:hypothetical protein